MNSWQIARSFFVSSFQLGEINCKALFRALVGIVAQSISYLNCAEFLIEWVRESQFLVTPDFHFFATKFFGGVKGVLEESLSNSLTSGGRYQIESFKGTVASGAAKRSGNHDGSLFSWKRWEYFETNGSYHGSVKLRHPEIASFVEIGSIDIVEVFMVVLWKPWPTVFFVNSSDHVLNGWFIGSGGQSND